MHNTWHKNILPSSYNPVIPIFYCLFIALKNPQTVISKFSQSNDDIQNKEKNVTEEIEIHNNCASGYYNALLNAAKFGNSGW